MDEIEKLADVFKALSDPTRLRLIKLLNKHGGALCVNALSHSLGVSQSAVSQHLRILRQVEMVKGERKGNSVHYELKKNVLKKYKTVIIKTLGEEFAIIT